MREVNEAWQVLQDPARRRRYDQEHLLARDRRPAARPAPRRGAAAPPRSTTPVPADADLDPDDDVPVHPLTAGVARHLPWVVLVVVFALIFVVTAYAGGSGDDPAPRPAGAATCVDVSPGPSTTVVPCTGDHELRIVARVVEGTACPPGTERRRLGDDGLLDCVVAS